MASSEIGRRYHHLDEPCRPSHSLDADWPIALFCATPRNDSIGSLDLRFRWEFFSITQKPKCERAGSGRHDWEIDSSSDFLLFFFFSSMDSARWHHWKLARQLSIAIAGDTLEIIPFGRSSFYWNWGERILKLFRFTEFKVVKGFFFTFLELFDFFGAEWTTS